MQTRIMSNFAAIMLSAFAAVTAAKTQVFRLANDWHVEFDSSNCGLTIDKHVDGQEVSRVRMFESDMHLLSTGSGDVDQIKIMTAGNITDFPKRSSKSSHMVCQPANITNDAKFSIGGKIVLTGDGEASTDF